MTWAGLDDEEEAAFYARLREEQHERAPARVGIEELKGGGLIAFVASASGISILKALPGDEVQTLFVGDHDGLLRRALEDASLARIAAACAPRVGR